MPPVSPLEMFLPIVVFLFGWVLAFAIGLLFVVLAARFATRAVLDEIAKDRARRGTSG